jgi:hypothetical protein
MIHEEFSNESEDEVTVNSRVQRQPPDAPG